MDGPDAPPCPWVRASRPQPRERGSPSSIRFLGTLQDTVGTEFVRARPGPRPRVDCCGIPARGANSQPGRATLFAPAELAGNARKSPAQDARKRPHGRLRRVGFAWAWGGGPSGTMTRADQADWGSSLRLDVSVLARGIGEWPRPPVRRHPLGSRSSLDMSTKARVSGACSACDYPSDSTSWPRRCLTCSSASSSMGS